MQNTSKKQLIASSSGWVAAVLNLIPGLGAGYIYQRRWRAYWLAILANFLLIFLGFVNEIGLDPSDPAPSQLSEYRFWTLLIVSSITSIEASFSVRNSRITPTKNE
ncbi:hypothetical protein [Prochlorococcus sp. MIT 1300]|uniref:hypothetical protein n=1 Tax=Prochlorococcus sp. MIT 1300 TaxID=3096218 RepID=UPI002A75B43C|nr:hypothetical protein [Prochlorococcus sp. MIT 1300]